jgi:hypothetical protein
MVHRILHMAGVVSSFEVAAEALAVVGEVQVSSRQINKLTDQMGSAMAKERDARTEQYLKQPVPREAIQAEPPIEVAAVFLDGGRMRTRQPDQGHGVHQPHWRESKNAAFHRMQSEPSEVDPQAELPDCFRNQAYVEKLVKGLKNLRKEGREAEMEEDGPATNTPEAEARRLSHERCDWQPKTVFRTCLSSLVSSEEFGPMMAAEADQRGFFAAQRKAFVGDGQSYNWSIQQRWFEDFVAVADFVHAVEYLYTAAKAVHAENASARWQAYVGCASACWQGRVTDVIAALRGWLAGCDPPTPGEVIAESDPRTIVRATVTYLTNNQSRMDYPSYRRAGLPVTSSLAESLVKQINRRVKGTEKFWNDGASGEAILQLRAAIISNGNRLQQWLFNRPVSPFSPRCRNTGHANSA